MEDYVYSYVKRINVINLDYAIGVTNHNVVVEVNYKMEDLVSVVKNLTVSIKDKDD